MVRRQKDRSQTHCSTHQMQTTDLAQSSVIRIIHRDAGLQCSSFSSDLLGLQSLYYACFYIPAHFSKAIRDIKICGTKAHKKCDVSHFQVSIPAFLILPHFPVSYFQSPLLRGVFCYPSHSWNPA